MLSQGPVNYSLFILDLDGTLVGRDEQISARVFDSIRMVAKRITVSIATGREPVDTLRFADHLRLKAPLICNNGAMIVDSTTGRPLWSVPIGRERTKILATRLQLLGTSFIATHPCGTITDAAKVAEQEVNRISALDLDESRADQLILDLGDLSDLYAVKVFLPYNGLWAVDFTLNGVDKGSGVRKLAEIQGVDVKKTIAVGDGMNDLPMLQVCGLSIAMAGSPEEVKAAAHYLAPSVDDDGLAVAIEEFVLPNL